MVDVENVTKIGNVRLDFSDYVGQDLYSDGTIEDIILECVKENKVEETLKTSTNWAILYHLSDIRKNLLEGFAFSGKEQVLEIGSGCGALTGVLADKAEHVTCVELSKKRSEINAYRNKDYGNIEIKVGNFQTIEKKLSQYDVITLIGVWEYAASYIKHENPYSEFIRMIKGHLKKDGVIIIAIENKMGIKYWNGALEDHTYKQYSGLNDYSNNETVRTFSKLEIEGILKKQGITNFSFYYPLPDYKIANEIYSDDYMPIMGAIRTFRTNYSSTQIYNFNDAIMWDQICSDGMFPYFANSFLVMIGKTDGKILYVKYNQERKLQYRIATKIVVREGKKQVIKYPLCQEAKLHVRRIFENAECLAEQSGCVRYVNGDLDQDMFVSDYIEGESLEGLLFQYRHDPLKLILAIKEIVLKVYNDNMNETQDFICTDSFKEVFGNEYPKNKRCRRYTNIDEIFQNMIIRNQKIYVFDCEWVFDFPIPIEYVTWRAIYMVYDKFNPYLMNKITKTEFLEQCGIAPKDSTIYEKMERAFAEFVCGDNLNEKYLQRYVKPAIMQETRVW